MADMLRCTKTGCNVWLAQRNEWAHGDAFEANGMLVLRLMQSSITLGDNPFDRLHFTVLDYGPWFDQDKIVSTMIAHSYTNHSYDGIPLAVAATPLHNSL